LSIKPYTNVALGSHRWLVPVILATREAEIKRIKVVSQPRQTVHENLSQKYPTQLGTMAHTCNPSYSEGREQ
jgi:hypothetical protein